jgi:hypothetical protein
VVFFHKTTITVLATLIVSAQVSMPAAAQTIPGSADVTRLQNDFENRNNLPRIPEAPAPLATPQSAPPSEAVPENADSITFTLRGIELQGVSVYKPRELEDLWRNDIGKTVSLKRVYDIAAAITARYQADGYFLSRAYIPAQEIGNGTVQIAIVEGYIQQVQLDGDIPSSHILGLLKKRLLSLGPLNIKMLERQMLLLNDLPGTHFRAVLKPLDNTVADSARVAAPPGGSSVNDNPASPPPQGSAGSKDPTSDARLITAAELEKFLGPDVTLKDGITRIDAGSGVAYSWQSGSLSGRAEQQKLGDPAGFDGQVSKYLDTSKERCNGAFAAKPDLKKEENGVVVSAYEIACVSEAGSTSASVLFFSQSDMFTTIAHEGSLDDMDAGMDIRDKLADKLLQSNIASAPAVETPAAPPPQGSLRSKDPRSDASLITAAELEKFLAPDLTLKDGITKIDTGLGVAYSWQSGSLSGRAEQQKLGDPAGFDGQVSKYLASSKERCRGAFAAKPGLKKEENDVVVSVYEIACVGEAGNTAASVLFFSQNDMFTTIAHEGSLDDMNAGMDISDKLADKLLQFKIASAKAATSPSDNSMNDKAPSPPQQSSAGRKGALSADVAASCWRSLERRKILFTDRSAWTIPVPAIWGRIWRVRRCPSTADYRIFSKP